MNYANNLLVNDEVSISNLMKAAHAKAKAAFNDRIELQRRGVKWTYAQDFKEALQYMWDRAKQMQRMQVAA